jgi:hypothetical protein
VQDIDWRKRNAEALLVISALPLMAASLANSFTFTTAYLKVADGGESNRAASELRRR